MPWLSLVELALIVVGMIDVIRIDESRVKYLPKVVWVLFIIFLPLLGIVLWFGLGRSYEGVTNPVRMPRPRPGPRVSYQPVTSTGPATATVRPVPSVDGRSTEQQLADLEREIEEDNRRRAEIEAKRRTAELTAGPGSAPDAGLAGTVDAADTPPSDAPPADGEGPGPSVRGG